MNRVTSKHLRGAYANVRQSTADQLLNNPESRHRRNYALAMRARSLGWEKVVVIDDDLVLPPMQFLS
jgi:hypothetical protein